MDYLILPPRSCAQITYPSSDVPPTSEVSSDDRVVDARPPIAMASSLNGYGAKTAENSFEHVAWQSALNQLVSISHMADLFVSDIVASSTGAKRDTRCRCNRSSTPSSIHTDADHADVVDDARVVAV